MNYPWSDRLGSIIDCCIYYGDSGPSLKKCIENTLKNLGLNSGEISI